MIKEKFDVAVSDNNLKYFGNIRLRGNNGTSLHYFQVGFKKDGVNVQRIIKALSGSLCNSEGTPYVPSNEKLWTSGNMYISGMNWDILIPKYELSILAMPYGQEIDKYGGEPFDLEDLSYATELEYLTFRQYTSNLANPILIGNLSALEKSSKMKTMDFTSANGIEGGLSDLYMMTNLTELKFSGTNIGKNNDGDIDALATAIAGTRNNTLKIICNGFLHYLNGSTVVTPTNNTTVTITFNGSGGYSIA